MIRILLVLLLMPFVNAYYGSVIVKDSEYVNNNVYKGEIQLNNIIGYGDGEDYYGFIGFPSSSFISSTGVFGGTTAQGLVTAQVIGEVESKKVDYRWTIIPIACFLLIGGYRRRKRRNKDEIKVNN